jgi:hypothetical protein
MRGIVSGNQAVSNYRVGEKKPSEQFMISEGFLLLILS